jgi:ubiquinone/menaquinone biosynthesis C-methylase UbiE
MASSAISEQVRSFYDQHPCGTDFVDPNNGFDEEFFRRYDRYRYEEIPSILEILDRVDWKGKRVLEIGTGLGADAQKIIERGGIYSAIDLTPASVGILRKRFEIFGLKYEGVREMNAEEMDLPDQSFDIVYSCGVLLTSPRIETIVDNIHKKLKAGGQAVIMLYHKNSLNYYVSISILRRIGVFFLFVPFVDRIVSKLTGEDIARLNKHKQNLRKSGLSYLRMKNFIHKATDGPDHPYSTVWTKKSCRKLFSPFSRIDFEVRFINKRHFPLIFDAMPARLAQIIERRLGWSLWIMARK